MYLSSQEQEVATDEVKTVIEVNVKVVAAAEVMVKIPGGGNDVTFRFRTSYCLPKSRKQNTEFFD